MCAKKISPLPKCIVELGKDLTTFINKNSFGEGSCVMGCVHPRYSILCVSSGTGWEDCSHVGIRGRTHRDCQVTPAKGCRCEHSR